MYSMILKSVGWNISGLWHKLTQQHVDFMCTHTKQLMNPLRLVFSVIIEVHDFSSNLISSIIIYY